MFSYQVLATQAQARAGLFSTPHGVVETPVFMPVGTHSAVRGLTWPQVTEAGAQIVLANAYHLFLRPGHQRVERFGGLHSWSGWKGPILTDSGGFQVFSLAKHRQVTDEGVRFKDPLTGDVHFIGPTQSMAIQNALGADVIMAFDECPPYPVTEAEAALSLDKTHRWLQTCFEAHQKPDTQALFPIVQGSTFEHLREKSVAFATSFNAHGYAIGGVSVGESKEWVRAVVRYTAPLLPADKPRYLMGVGTPEDLLQGIASGIDMFDCVMPTRIARHGTFFTPKGRRIIRNAEFEDDPTPLVEGCACYTCQHHHKAYIRHLYRQKEVTAGVLLSIHNVYTLIQVAQVARRHIMAGTFSDYYQLAMSDLLPVGQSVLH
jgi:queuine tRNA-ribosyltransferase